MHGTIPESHKDPNSSSKNADSRGEHSSKHRRKRDDQKGAGADPEASNEYETVATASVNEPTVAGVVVDTVDDAGANQVNSKCVYVYFGIG